MFNKNIFRFKNCYGCGVCAISCPQNIITIELDKNGFYHPTILQNNKCTYCGICLNVCSYSHNELSIDKSDEIHGYAAWSNIESIRSNCSSGGIGFELGKYLLSQGYKACGVKYNIDKNWAEHFIAENEIDYRKSIGSKYIQSYTFNAFNAFNKNEKYFVTGTPCQIDSLRRYIRLKKIEEKFILMDFFCHGVPSMLMWRKYILSVGRRIGSISNVAWRNKKTGWHDSWAICVSNKNAESADYYSSWSMGDLFYKMFLGNNCLGKACYNNCKYKLMSSSADIRIGDLWGEKYKNNTEGVNGVLIFTDTGKYVIQQLQNCKIIPETIDVITDGQMNRSPKKPVNYYLTLFLLRTIMPLNLIYIIISLMKKLFRILDKSLLSKSILK